MENSDTSPHAPVSGLNSASAATYTSATTKLTQLGQKLEECLNTVTICQHHIVVLKGALSSGNLPIGLTPNIHMNFAHISEEVRKKWEALTEKTTRQYTELAIENHQSTTTKFSTKAKQIEEEAIQLFSNSLFNEEQKLGLTRIWKECVQHAKAVAEATAAKRRESTKRKAEKTDYELAPPARKVQREHSEPFRGQWSDKFRPRRGRGTRRPH